MIKIQTNVLKKDIKEKYRDLCKFLWNNRWCIFLTCMMILLIYGYWIFDANPHIDTEDFINTPYSVYGLQSGRPGKFFTSFMFRLRWYNPFMSNMFGFALFCVCAVLLQYFLYRFGNIRGILSSIFAVIVLCSPIMVEQIYFFSQIFEMAWAYLICIIAVMLSYHAILHRAKLAYIGSIICLVWTFGTYQIYTVLFVTLVVVGFLLLSEKWIFQEKADVKILIYRILKLVSIFVIAYGINMIINHIWFSEGMSYLNAMRYWGKDSVITCIKNIYLHIYSAMTGGRIHYTIFYGVFVLAAVLVSFIRIVKERIKTGWFYLLMLLSLQICPFLMTIYLGKEPVIRSQIVYPLVLGCNMIICVKNLEKNIALKKVCAILTVICLWMQLIPTMRLIYTDGIREQEDRNVMNEIVYRVHEISETSKPIAFVGRRKNNLNNACLRGEMIGKSIFNIDAGANPHYFFSTVRICENGRVMGFDMQHASEEQVKQARKEAMQMPEWPVQGSVKDCGDYIVVKLSEDKWSDEL